MEGGYLNNDPIVYIVDDDAGIRRSLTSLMRSMDLESAAFHSAVEFLDVFNPMQSGCLLLDVSLPGTSGLELLEHINSQVICIPAVVISADGDVPTVVRAMRRGRLIFWKSPAAIRCFWNRYKSVSSGAHQSAPIGAVGKSAPPIGTPYAGRIRRSRPNHGGQIEQVNCRGSVRQHSRGGSPPLKTHEKDEGRLLGRFDTNDYVDSFSKGRRIYKAGSG